MGLGASLGIGDQGGAGGPPLTPRRERVPDDLGPGLPTDREASLRRRLLGCRVDREGATGTAITEELTSTRGRASRCWAFRSNRSQPAIPAEELAISCRVAGR